MIKEALKKKSASIITKTAERFAQRDSAQACMYFLYQPKQPKALKKEAK